MSKILVLPGIGDIYWVATVLEDFCKVNNLGVPDVYIWDIDGRRRSIEFAQRIPFINTIGYFDAPHKNVEGFHESYRTGERCVFPGTLGFDYYIAFNGWLQAGKPIDGSIPGVKTNWSFQLLRTEEDLDAEAALRKAFPDGYILAHLSSFGMFRHWIKKWKSVGCAILVKHIQKATGLPVLITGCEWDAPFAEKIMQQLKGRHENIYNYCTLTTPDQFYGMLHGATGMVGWCGGNTILATHLKVPTLMLWSNVYFTEPAFYRHACSPESWENWYESRVIEESKPEIIAQEFVSLLKRRGVL